MKIVLAFLLLVVPLVCFAGSLSGKLVTVKGEVGKISEVVFSQDVARIAKGASSEVLQIEVVGNRIYLLPLQKAESDIYVITKDGVSYPVTVLADGQGYDLRVEAGGPRETDSAGNRGNGVQEFLRAMFLDVEPADGESFVCDQEVFNQQGLRWRVKKIVRAAAMTGYVVEAENLSSASIVVPIQDIDLPGLLAISADRQVLEPQGKENSRTFVYMVLGE